MHVTMKHISEIGISSIINEIENSDLLFFTLDQGVIMPVHKVVTCP